MMIDNPVIKLCIAGTQAEYQGQIEKARAYYLQAWEAVRDDYDACIAAHYVARHQEDPSERLRWNQIALDSAKAVAGDRVQGFFASLYLNMGQSYELLGDWKEAERYYELAAEAGITHQKTENTREMTQE